MTKVHQETTTLTQGQIELVKAQVWKERAMMLQSLAMALLTGMSAAAVGMAMYTGRHPPPVNLPK